MKAIVFSGYEDLAKAIGMKIFQWEFRHFPDGESYVRIIDPVPESITILCGLEHPDTKIVPLILLTRTLRRLGAKHITPNFP